MMNELDFKKLVSENLQYYRKLNNMTQLQLAEILNYSDKSISKWERGESLPDLYILANIAKIYGITINDLTSEIKTKPIHKRKLNKFLISLIAVGIVWLIATITFVALDLFVKNLDKNWLAFVYAIPISMIVLLVFTNIWGNKLQVFFTLTILYWSVPLSIFLTINEHRLWLLFIIVIPLQIITIFWFLINKDKTIIIENSEKNKGENLN